MPYIKSCDNCLCTKFLLLPDGDSICDECGNIYEYNEKEFDWDSITDCENCEEHENNNENLN